MMIRLTILLQCVFLFSNLNASAQPLSYDTIRVSDFGARVNSRENATPIVKMAIAKAKELENPLLIFDQGRCDF